MKLSDFRVAGCKRRSGHPVSSGNSENRNTRISHSARKLFSTMYSDGYRYTTYMWSYATKIPEPLPRPITFTNTM